MYLIISSEITNNYIKDELCKLNINIIDIPCVQLTPDTAIIHQFKQQINNFDIIIITSPTTIQYAQDIIKTADKKLIFIVPGKSSYAKLRQYTHNKIYAPEHNSGSEAITGQVLSNMDLMQKKIAIIQGKIANHSIQDYLDAKLGLNSYTQIILYQQKWLDLNTQNIKKFLQDNSLQGIILTSSMHAQYLFSQAKKFGYYDMLIRTDFITLHTKIQQVLQRLGAKGHIFVSDNASNEALINLMEKLHDRHDKHSKS
ncbi:MAG TPA: uroporphyrinogen-III synthase [Aquella sp.]|nr:uroporphyrinogen-III synthase [Aquella sp.]